MKSKYWSCSKFADCIRGPDKPYSETSAGWNDWEKRAKNKKFRYWLAETGIDSLQSAIYSPITLINSVRCYVSNRWITKTHTLSSNLRRGVWHEFDTRLIHTIFDELVNFVEIDLALMTVMSSNEDRKKYKAPWYYTVFRIGTWRNIDAGIAYLNWASKLTFNEDSGADKLAPDFGKPTAQALAALDILALYKWWKTDRPNRPDPSEESGWNAYCDKKNDAEKTNGDNPLHAALSAKNVRNKGANEILNVYSQMEKQQEEEDTSMLISRWREMICRYVASIFIFSLLQRTNCLKLNPNIAANPDASIV